MQQEVSEGPESLASSKGSQPAMEVFLLPSIIPFRDIDDSYILVNTKENIGCSGCTFNNNEDFMNQFKHIFHLI